MRFMSLRRSVWQHPEISVKTKIQIYRAIVLSTTLYGSENLTCTEKGYASLNAFHNKNLRTILGEMRSTMKSCIKEQEYRALKI